MSSQTPVAAPCIVVASHKLPEGITTSTVCSAIATAMKAHASAQRYEVEVQVLSASRISALLTVGGRALPKFNLAVSDGRLTISAIRRFANTLATAAADR